MSESGPSVPVPELYSSFITGRTTFVSGGHIRMVLKGEMGFLGEGGALAGEEARVGCPDVSLAEESLEVESLEVGSTTSTSLLEPPASRATGLKKEEMRWLGLVRRGALLGRLLVFLGTAGLAEVGAPGVESQPPTSTTSLSLPLALLGDLVAVSLTIGSSTFITFTGRVFCAAKCWFIGLSLLMTSGGALAVEGTITSFIR